MLLTLIYYEFKHYVINCASPVSKPLTCWKTSFGILLILMLSAVLKFPIPMHPAIPLSIPGAALDQAP